MEDAPETGVALPHAMEVAADLLRMVRPEDEAPSSRPPPDSNDDVVAGRRSFHGSTDGPPPNRGRDDLAFVVDAEGVVELVSAQTLGLFSNVPVGAIVGKRIDDLLCPASGSRARSGWSTGLLERARIESVARLDVVIADENAPRSAAFEIVIRPMIDLDSAPRYLVAIEPSARGHWSETDATALLARCLADIGIAVVEEPSLVAFVKRCARVLQAETGLPAVRVRAFIGFQNGNSAVGVRAPTTATYPEAGWISRAPVTFATSPGFDHRTCVIEVLEEMPSDAQRRVLDRVSARLATAVVKRWSEERLIQLAAHFTSLDRVSNALAASRGEPTELADFVAMHASTSSGTACVVELSDAESGSLDCRVVRGSDAALAEELAEFVANRVAPSNAARGFASVIPPGPGEESARESTAFSLGAMRQAGLEIGSSIAVPILAGGEPVGWIGVCRRPYVSSLDDDERAFLRAVADRLGLAVSNARLFRENRRHVEQLEGRVRDRTAALETAIDDLQVAQNELVQAEKLSSLGALVAGIAHELNTPIGNALVIATSLEALVRDLRKGVEAGSLRRSDFTRFVEDCTSATEILVRCLGSARELISSFKQVAADQSSEQRRTFDLVATTRDVVDMNLPSLKRRDYHFTVTGDETVGMDSYPGAFGRIVTNLVQNAVIHGFDGLESGHVELTVRAEGEFVASLEVSDNGRGIPSDALAHIFDAFYTTKLGRGGSGLGLQIVYNLVTNVLGGRIDVRANPERGVTFRVVMPRVAPTRLAPPGGSE